MGSRVGLLGNELKREQLRPQKPDRSAGEPALEFPFKVDKLIDRVSVDLFAISQREVGDRLVVGIAKFDEGGVHRPRVKVEPKSIAAEREQRSLQPTSLVIDTGRNKAIQPVRFAIADQRGRLTDRACWRRRLELSLCVGIRART